MVCRLSGHDMSQNLKRLFYLEIFGSTLSFIMVDLKQLPMKLTVISDLVAAHQILFTGLCLRILVIDNHNVPSSKLDLDISRFSFNSKKNFSSYLRVLGTDNFCNLDELQQYKSVTSES